MYMYGLQLLCFVFSGYICSKLIEECTIRAGSGEGKKVKWQSDTHNNRYDRKRDINKEGNQIKKSIYNNY